MSTNQQQVANEIERRKIATAAARSETRPLLKKGWICLLVGWCCPVIGLLGMAGLILMTLVAFWIGVLVWTRGNGGGALTLMLTGVFGSGLVGVLWTLVNMFVFHRL